MALDQACIGSSKVSGLPCSSCSIISCCSRTGNGVEGTSKLRTAMSRASNRGEEKTFQLLKSAWASTPHSHKTEQLRRPGVDIQFRCTRTLEKQSVLYLFSYEPGNFKVGPLEMKVAIS
jgi:hypothetical protein